MPVNSFWKSKSERPSLFLKASILSMTIAVTAIHNIGSVAQALVSFKGAASCHLCGTVSALLAEHTSLCVWVRKSNDHNCVPPPRTVTSILSFSNITCAIPVTDFQHNRLGGLQCLISSSWQSKRKQPTLHYGFNPLYNLSPFFKNGLGPKIVVIPSAVTVANTALVIWKSGLSNAMLSHKVSL